MNVLTLTALVCIGTLQVFADETIYSPFSIVSFHELPHQTICRIFSNGRSLLWNVRLVLIAIVVIWNTSDYSSHLFVLNLYVQVIDGGSTGSRLHIFEFVTTNATTGETDCVRRGSERSHKPLSYFGRTNTSVALNATYVADHMIHLFEYAATIIPEEYHMSTTVRYAATAGMRLLDPDEQEAVYDALYDGLMEFDSFVFQSMQREDISTLSGELEGFYGAVAANFLVGAIDTKLKTNNDEEASHGPLGALDMGGSSTQIVYLPGNKRDEETCKEDSQTCHAHFEVPDRLNGDDFFSTSYLAYGVDQFRERLWDTWVSDQEKSGSLHQISNPCANHGYSLEWKGYTLIGTGDAEACAVQVRRLIPHHEPDRESQLGGKVGGVEHPPLRGKFFAMSLYFFSLDSLRVLSHRAKDAYHALNSSWPNPSIAELYNALDGLCGRSWHDDLEHDDHGHAFTRAEVLPHRCLEAVYMVTLLKDGFGFEWESRDITFTFLVDGSEVEWSLGMALSMHADEQVGKQNHQQRSAVNVTVEIEIEHKNLESFIVLPGPLDGRELDEHKVLSRTSM